MNQSTITEAVKSDLDARTAKGIKEYGQPLSPYMGEDALKHAYEEALNLAQYLKLRLSEESTSTYQCYWKDRALAAEKLTHNETPTKEAEAKDIEVSECKNCGKTPSFRRSVDTRSLIWKTQCPGGGWACTEAKALTLVQCLINWNKLNTP